MTLDDLERPFVTIKLADAENPRWYQNLGMISYENRVIANMAVRGPHCGVC